MAAIAGNDEKNVDPDVLLTNLYDVAVHFVLLHELYHVYSGHLAYSRKNFGLNCVSEAKLGLSEGATGLDEVTAYYLEFEADSNAVTSLLSHVRFEGLHRQAGRYSELDESISSVHEMDGQARAYGFRMVLAAVLITGALIEANRRNSLKHPLPAARLLSLAATSMAWYAELDAMQPEVSGAFSQMLSDKQIASLEDFLFQVVKPIFVMLWEFPDVATSERLGLYSKTSNAGKLLIDLKALTFNEPLNTPAGHQIERIERAQKGIKAALSPCRLFSPTRDD